MTADKRVTQATFQPSSFIMHGDNVKLRSLGGTPSIVVTCQLTVDRQRGIRSWWSIIFPRQPSWVERGSGLSRKKKIPIIFLFSRGEIKMSKERVQWITPSYFVSSNFFFSSGTRFILKIRGFESWKIVILIFLNIHPFLYHHRK